MAKKNSGVTVDKKEWNRLKKVMLAAASQEVQTGWFDGQRYGPENQNLPMAQVASWQEEGTIGGQKNGSGIPPRPFIRTFITGLKRSKAFQVFVKYHLKQVMDGKRTWNSFYRLLGKFVRQGLQATMLKWSTPPNAASTVKAKGFNDPLIESGTLWKSIKTRIMKAGKRGKR